MAIIIGLDNLQELVCTQAKAKGWKTDSIYCIKRIIDENDGEMIELKNAIRDKKSQMEKALEIIDNIYFLVQVAKEESPDISLDKAFDIKYQDNWKTKKKTEDEDGNPVRR